MDYARQLHDFSNWLFGVVYSPPEIIRTATAILIAWFLGWLQLFYDEKRKQRNWFASQVLDGIRDLKRLALVTGEARIDWRLEGVNRLLRQIDRVVNDDRFFSRTQREAVRLFRDQLQNYKDEFVSLQNLMPREREAWKALIDGMYKVLATIDRSYSKKAGPERLTLANLRTPEAEAATQTLKLSDAA